MVNRNQELLREELDRVVQLSPLLFSIYAEMMMMEVLEGMEEGVRIGGVLISDIRFADDQGMVASSELGLQRLMDRLNAIAKKYSMKINIKKTKTMVVSKKMVEPSAS